MVSDGVGEQIVKITRQNVTPPKYRTIGERFKEENIVGNK